MTVLDQRRFNTGAPPARSELQRLDALERANAVRVYRKELKRDLKVGRVDVVALLLADPIDDRLSTMKVFDLLIAVPKYGRVKANAVLKRERISPSRTLGGLSTRQRHALIGRLARPTLFDDARRRTQPPVAAAGVRSRTAASGADRV